MISKVDENDENYASLKDLVDLSKKLSDVAFLNGYKLSIIINNEENSSYISPITNDIFVEDAYFETLENLYENFKSLGLYNERTCH